MNPLTNHLEEVDETYFEHLRHASRFSVTMAVGSIACLVHAIFPFLFTKAGSAIITKMHHDMVTHRSSLSINEDFQVESAT